MDKRVLGIIGSLFYILSFLPHIGLYFIIFGFIALFFALKDISQKIAKNLFIGFLINSLGYGVYIIWGIGTIISILAYLNDPNSTIALSSVILGVLGVLGGMYILGVISSIFYKNAFVELRNITNNKYFEWGGYLILFGYLSMIFIIGIFIVIAGWGFIAFGFFQLKERKLLPKPSPKEFH